MKNGNLLSRLNEYRIMWLFVFFDLPTESKRDRKVASKFRKYLIEDGFNMFQFSIYIRCCPSKENAMVHIKRLKQQLPKYGKIGILRVTDKQFGMMELFYGQKEIAPDLPVQQLELF